MQVTCYAKKEGMGFVFVDLEDFFLLELVIDDTPVPPELDELITMLMFPLFSD